MVVNKLNIFSVLLLVLLTSLGLVSAQYYGGNYGYENYYNSYDYQHGFGNSRPINRQPNLVSISSHYSDENYYFYNSGSNYYRSYNSRYPGYSGKQSESVRYSINKYYPYYSYVDDESFHESSSPYSYSRHQENNRRLLSRPEHYLVYWSYR